MSLQVLTDPKEIKNALEVFRRKMKSNCERMTRYIGWQGGGRDLPVYWNSHWKIWTTFLLSENKRRHVGFFGVQDPTARKSLSITCEINQPLINYDRRVAGVILRDNMRRIYVAHSGKIGSGQPGIGKERFLATYGGDQLETIEWPNGKTSDVLILGRINAPDLASHTRDFAFAVAAFKQSPTTTSRTKPSGLLKALSTPEFEGSKQSYRHADLIEPRCYHGRVVNALMDILKRRKRIASVERDMLRDLVIKSANGTVTHIFEAKTDISTSSIYRAIGQLMFHSAPLRPRPKTIMVLPRRPTKPTQAILKMLGVQTLIFRLEAARVIFRNLDVLIR